MKNSILKGVDTVGDQNELNPGIVPDEQEYDGSQIQVLEGLEAVQQAPWHVYWIDRTARPASSGV